MPVDRRRGADNHDRMDRITRVARRCLISGRVQGVYYRASARERARAAGIAGHARNLPDGRVEVLACGEEAAVQEFIAWLWIGPVAAKVTGVAVESLELAPHEHPREFKTS
jgi:acylphosphatase